MLPTSDVYLLYFCILQNRKMITGRTQLSAARQGTPITAANRYKQQVPVQQSTSAYHHQTGTISPPASTTAQLISAMSQETTNLLYSMARDLSNSQNSDNILSAIATHRKLDRSVSEPAPDKSTSAKNVNSSRYKTELCRPFEENGFCKYGEKCQFAHGIQEVRSLSRHPKYKTELCRTYHTVGFCPYGPRCHFIHNEDEHKLSEIIQQKNQQVAQQAAQQVVQAAAQQQALQHAVSCQGPPSSAATTLPNMRPTSQSLAINLNVLDRQSLGSTADSPPSSVTDSPTTLSPTFPMGAEEMFSGFSAAYTPPPASAPAAPVSSCAFTFPEYITLQSQAAMQQNSSNHSTPLNIQTDQLVSSLNSLHLSQSNSVTVQNNMHNNLLNETLLSGSLTDPSVVAPPSPPESLNGDTSPVPPSPPASTAAPGCSSPLDIGRGLRLPIFSRLASKDQ